MALARPEDTFVLVVDDERDVVNYLAALLEDAGFQVAKATDGEQALAIVKERRPDLISLDLVMPGKSGAKFLYHLRRNADWSKIPVLVVTGHAHDALGKGDLDDILAGKVISGPAVYLEKPVSPQSYVSAVKRQLGMETVLRSGPAGPEAAKSEVQRLLDTADPATVQNILKLLKKPDPSVPPAEAAGAPKARILVIDDEPDVARYLSAFLSDCGYAAEPATDPNDALARAQAQPPDLITLDIDLPGKSGVDVYREMRSIPALSKVKVVVITAVPQKIRAHPGGQAMLDEIEGYLTKPFEPQVLQETIAAALAR